MEDTRSQEEKDALLALYEKQIEQRKPEPKYPEGAKTVAMFVGDPTWYTLTEFIDPEAGRPTGWAEAAAGDRSVWIDLAMAYTVFVYDRSAMLAEWAARQQPLIENWTKMRP